MVNLIQFEILIKFFHKLFQIVLNLSKDDTQKKLDKALKRNINPQQQVTSVAKSPTAELPVEEPISETDEALEE